MKAVGANGVGEITKRACCRAFLELPECLSELFWVYEELGWVALLAGVVVGGGEGSLGRVELLAGSFYSGCDGCNWGVLCEAGKSGVVVVIVCSHLSCCLGCLGCRRGWPLVGGGSSIEGC